MSNQEIAIRFPTICTLLEQAVKDKDKQELKKLGAVPTKCDPSVYIKDKSNRLLFIIVYVDDILIFSKSSKKIDVFYESMRKSFCINDMAEINYCLGIHFSRNQSGIKMSQETYIANILERFGMSNSKPVSTPLDPGTKLSRSDTWTEEDGLKPPYRELTGALMYLAVATRPDICCQSIVPIQRQLWQEPLGRSKARSSILEGLIKHRNHIQKFWRWTQGLRRCGLGGPVPTIADLSLVIRSLLTATSFHGSQGSKGP